MLKRAMARPQSGTATFVTGGEVSRFARSTVPKKGESSIVTTPNGVYSVSGGGAPAGPTVRVHRGSGAASEDPVAKAAGALFTEMMKDQAGATAPVASSAKSGK